LQELLNRTVVTLSDLRTDVEEMKWQIMRKVVCTLPQPYSSPKLLTDLLPVTLAAFVVLTIVSMELKAQMNADKNKKPPPPPPSTTNIPPVEGLERTEWVT
jgi:hypothetical protein